ncbi:tRNA-splicing endonuclease subunit Sen54-like isoform X2 [Mangifera indica]|uniref:tRNA-splicing endonuclease subunit Sen54-like isoform X2 n=1 Tax=Mangifera indica TaxID=29780 RepID=UPI001CFACF0E|nr:tRNA-splicing endonuclease subunit Sen54-like isoform X2 [Mangifera indica]
MMMKKIIIWVLYQSYNSGMAEVVEKKGKMWTTTAIIRNGKTFCSIEETLFLAEIGALLLLDDNDSSLPLKFIYEKVAKAKTGCSWELFEVYRHLKSLGYIVRRHGVPWTKKITEGKNVDIISDSVSLQGSQERNEDMDLESRKAGSIIDLFSHLQINEAGPVFDVYLPNRKFKKSCPGDPNFMLYLMRACPPSKTELEVLERQCSNIPLKFCCVEHGRVSFFSFDRVELPILP